MMTMQKADKATISIVQGQRVYSGLYGGRYGIVIGIQGEQKPNSVRSMGGGVITYGGGASFDVVFDNHISNGIPESIIRGVQWDIYDSVASADEILDAIAKANAHQAEAKRKDAEAKARREAERAKLIADNPHLSQGNGGKVGAANIRKELKAAFPKVKFSVTSDYDSIRIKWTDGPTVEQVKAITGKYEEGSFDGMQDMFVYDPDAVFADVFGGVRYVTEYRATTPALEAKAWKAYLGDTTGFQCEGEFVPNELPEDWQTRYKKTSTLCHIRKVINDYSA